MKDILTKFNLVSTIIILSCLIGMFFNSKYLIKYMSSLKESKEYENKRKEFSWYYNMSIAMTVLSGIPLFLLIIIVTSNDKIYRLKPNIF